MRQAEDRPAITLADVTVTFGDLVALDHLSFQVPRGSITGLIGRNGAGKSTAINCLAGLLQPVTDESFIRVMGFAPISDHVQLASSAGFLLSEPALFGYLTPTETLRFLAEAYRIPTPAADERVRELLRFFELEDAAARLVEEFSTGMSKRLALAAALLHSPPVLILDEPFESLDPLMVRSLKGLLARYAANGGTVLLSSHLIDAVEEICDRVVILEKGRVVSAGTTEEAKAGIIESLPAATLEDLYASLMPEADLPPLEWLAPLRSVTNDDEGHFR